MSRSLQSVSFFPPLHLYVAMKSKQSLKWNHATSNRQTNLRSPPPIGFEFDVPAEDQLSNRLHLRQTSSISRPIKLGVLKLTNWLPNLSDRCDSTGGLSGKLPVSFTVSSISPTLASLFPVKSSSVSRTSSETSSLSCELRSRSVSPS